MLIPTTGRIIVELVREPQGAIITLESSSSIGENLQCARIVHPGDSDFKKGQLVAVMEYSMAGIYKDLAAFERGVSRTDLGKKENQYHVVAREDIVAYDDSGI